jgi:ribosomal protein S27E
LFVGFVGNNFSVFLIDGISVLWIVIYSAFPELNAIHSHDPFSTTTCSVCKTAIVWTTGGVGNVDVLPEDGPMLRAVIERMRVR